jgi:hypothetical protein
MWIRFGRNGETPNASQPHHTTQKSDTVASVLLMVTFISAKIPVFRYVRTVCRVWHIPHQTKFPLHVEKTFSTPKTAEVKGLCDLEMSK